MNLVLLEKLIISTGPLVITGDFNFHLDGPNDRTAARFRGMLDIFDLPGMSGFPTKLFPIRLFPTMVRLRGKPLV